MISIHAPAQGATMKRCLYLYYTPNHFLSDDKMQGDPNEKI